MFYSRRVIYSRGWSYRASTVSQKITFALDGQSLHSIFCHRNPILYITLSKTPILSFSKLIKVTKTCLARKGFHGLFLSKYIQKLLQIFYLNEYYRFRWWVVSPFLTIVHGKPCQIIANRSKPRQTVENCGKPWKTVENRSTKKKFPQSFQNSF